MKVPISLFNNVVVFYVAEQSLIKSGFRGWSGCTTYVKGKGTVFRFEESGSSDIDHAEAEKRYRKIRFRDSFSAFIFV